MIFRKLHRNWHLKKYVRARFFSLPQAFNVFQVCLRLSLNEFEKSQAQLPSSTSTAQLGSKKTSQTKRNRYSSDPNQGQISSLPQSDHGRSPLVSDVRNQEGHTYLREQDEAELALALSLSLEESLMQQQQPHPHNSQQKNFQDVGQQAPSFKTRATTLFSCPRGNGHVRNQSASGLQTSLNSANHCSGSGSETATTFVACPVGCGRQVCLNKVNQHVDECLTMKFLGRD